MAVFSLLAPGFHRNILQLPHQLAISIGLVVLAVALILTPWSQVFSQTPGAELTFSPNTQSVAPQQIGHIDVQISPNQQQVNGVDLLITYDPNIIQIDNVQPGTFFTNPVTDPNSLFSFSNLNTSGEIHYALAFPLGSNLSSNTEGLTAARINYTAKNTGQTNINLITAPRTGDPRQTIVSDLQANNVLDETQTNTATISVTTGNGQLFFNNLSPENPQTVAQQFTLDVVADSGGEEIIGVDAHINFDPQFLQVNDLQSKIESGLTSFPLLTYDNTLGTITIAANVGSGQNSTPINSNNINFAQISFTPTNNTAGSEISFDFTPADRNDSNIVLNQSSADPVDILGSVTNTTIIIGSTPTNTPTPSATATPSPTNTPSPLPTATNTPTPTATPTSTPTPTATATPTSAPTPTPTIIGNVLDNFDRNSGPLTGSWSGDTNQFSINSDQLQTSQGNHTILWNTLFGDEQQVFLRFTQIDPNADEYNLILKAQTLSNSAPMLALTYNPNVPAIQVWSSDGQNWTKIGNNIPFTIQNGDILLGEITNNLLTIQVNDTTIGTQDISSWNHSAKAGYIGIKTNNATNALLDDFGGKGNPPTSTPTPTPTLIPSIPPTSTPTPTNTPTPQPTNTPSPTNTPAPTATITPTPSSNPSPTATPTPDPEDVTIKIRTWLQGKTRPGISKATAYTFIHQTLDGIKSKVFNIDTDDGGNHDFAIKPGKYIFLLDAPGYLARKFGTNQNPIDINNTSSEVDLSEFPLPGGDFNDDGTINEVDYAQHFLPNFFKKSDGLVDLDNSGQVNNLDFSIMRNNWGLNDDTL